MRSKNKQKKIIFLISSILAVLVGILIVLTTYINKEPVQEEVPQEIVEPQEEVIPLAPKEYLDKFHEFQAKAYKKEDYKCQILFDSGLIDQPVLQGENNSEYLRKDYETNKYRVDGPVFMDYLNNPLEDQNVILYGHDMPKSMDPKQVQLFTPLHVFNDENNYEKNKIVNLIFEDRVEVYLICMAYDINVYEVNGAQYLRKGEPEFYHNYYTQEEFENYMSIVNDRKFYDTGEEITFEDKMLTLQTCYETNINKLIVLAKKINTLYYE